MTIKNKKIAKRACAVMLSMAMAIGTIAPSTNVDAASKGKVTSVSVKNVEGNTLVLKKKGKFSLKTTVKGTGKYSKKVTYKTSKKKVVKVTKKGKLTAVKKGKAKITITSVGNKKIKTSINVMVGIPVTGITLDKSTASGKVGESIKLAATVAPENASVKDVKYISEDENIATVDANGNVICKAVGSVKIIATAMDGNGKKAECTVTVTAEDKKNEQPQAPSTPVSPADDKKDDNVDDKQDDKKEDDKSDDKKEDADKDEEKKEEVELSSPVELSMDGYNEEPVWKEEFSGDSLNLDDWNVETHPPKWVNNEWQEYVDSTKNIYVKDGKLYLVPIKNGEGESATYTSGRINTMGKHDFKYGLFEATLKVPEGQGYLPAFWMMPTNESLYGQWPKCGEIDAMEVMGQDTNKLYGTIHYGGPTASEQVDQQGTAVFKDDSYAYVESKKNSDINEKNFPLTNGNSFSSDYHTFSVEWEPDHITWYVDGIKYHEATDWFTKNSSGAIASYPAPFDQNFYMILNLAVGGGWVGYPDDTTPFGENAAMIVDSVKVYQKDPEYYANKEKNAVKPASEDVDLREPDENGNYINNGDFSEEENLEDGVDWQFMTANGGEGTADIKDGEILINTTNEGTVDYSVQLVQWDVPFEKGAEYKISFDAYSKEQRSMNVAVKAPYVGWAVYASENVNLGTQYGEEPYQITFKMKRDTDAKARLEFNMGATGSTADIHIKNVKIEKINDADPAEENIKEVRADGNYIYNGSFDEGDKRLGFWEIPDDKKDYVSVTNKYDSENNAFIRMLKIEAPEGISEENPIIISQTGLTLSPLKDNKKYAVSYTAYKEYAEEGDTSLKVKVGSFTIDDNVLTSAEKGYSSTFTYNENDPEKFELKFTKPGTYYVDNIVVAEDTIIRNGTFDSGKLAYELYSAEAAKASWDIDSLSNDGNPEAVINVKNTGENEWDVQLKQTGVAVEKDHWYALTFNAKSSIDRQIRAVIQKSSGDYAAYGDIFASLTATKKAYTKIFKMEANTDSNAQLSICVGVVNDKKITTEHEIHIDDIVMVDLGIEAPVSAADENILSTQRLASEIATWSNPAAEASYQFSDNKHIFNVTNVGANPWDIQLKQSPITLIKGETYEISFDVVTEKQRKIMCGVQHNGSLDKSNYYIDHYNSGEIEVGNGEVTTVKEEFTMNTDDTCASFFISMGNMTDEDTDELGKVTISNPVLKRIEKEIPAGTNLLRDVEFTNPQTDDSWTAYGGSSNPQLSTGVAVFSVSGTEKNAWDVALFQKGLKLVKGEKYKLTFKASSTADRTISVGFQNDDGQIYYGGNGEVALTSGLEEKTIELNMSDDAPADGVKLMFSLGKITKYDENGNATKYDTPASTIRISDLKLVKVE